MKVFHLLKDNVEEFNKVLEEGYSINNWLPIGEGYVMILQKNLI